MITDNIILIPALDYANQAGNALTSNVVLLGGLTKLEDAINYATISYPRVKEAGPDLHY